MTLMVAVGLSAFSNRDTGGEQKSISDPSDDSLYPFRVFPGEQRNASNERDDSRSKAGNPYDPRNLFHIVHALPFRKPGVARLCHFVVFLCSFGTDLSGQRRMGRKGRSLSRFDGRGVFYSQKSWHRRRLISALSKSNDLFRQQAS
jgi:hypothetical protein